MRGAGAGRVFGAAGSSGARLSWIDAAGAFDGFRQPAAFHRLEQIVHCLQAEGLHGVLVVGGHEDEVGQLDVLFAQPADHAQAIQPGHIYIQKNQLGLQFLDQFHRLQTVGTPCNYFNFREIVEQVGKFVAG